MDLIDIIRDATGGFLAGFGLGISGLDNKYTEKVEVIEESFSKEQREKHGFFSDEGIAKFKKNEKKGKLFFPFTVGGIYSTIYDLTTPEHTFIENAVVAIPSCYLGRFVGSAVRKIIRKPSKKDLEILENIKNDPGNALNYISQDEREAIKASLGEIEKKILNREELIGKELKNKQSPIIKIYDAITKQNKIYSPILLKWSVDKFKEIAERTHLQRELINFYENAPPVSVSILGVPENTSVRIYEIDGDVLKKYTANFNNFEIAEDEAFKSVEIFVNVPKMKLKNKQDWKKNYKELADEIIKENGSYTAMFIKTTPNMPDTLRESLVTEVFAIAYATKGDKSKSKKHNINLYKKFRDFSLN